MRSHVLINGILGNWESSEIPDGEKRTSRHLFGSFLRGLYSLPFFGLTDSRSSSLRGSTITDEKKGDVVCLAGAARETLNGTVNCLLEIIQRYFVPSGNRFPKAREAEQFLVGVGCFGDSIAKENERVASFDFHASGFVLRPGNEAHWKGALRKRLGNFAATNKQW